MEAKAYNEDDIKRAMGLIFRIADKYGLTVEANSDGTFSWFEVWRVGVEDIVGMVDDTQRDTKEN